MTIVRPINDYDPNWIAYWAQNPTLLRAVGADEAGDDAGDEGDAGDAGDAGASDEGGDAGGDGAGEATDWRTSIADEKLREHAGRFNSIDDLVKGNLDQRSKLSQAIVPPGKDASPEEVAAYNKRMDIPETAEGYGLTSGSEDPSEGDKAFMGWAANLFHTQKMTAAQAKGVNEAWNEFQTNLAKEKIAEDDKYAAESDAALRTEWGPDYDANKSYAERAFDKIADADAEGLRNIETKDGKYLLDDPRMLKIFAKLGREMGEGNLGGARDQGEILSINAEIASVRKQITEAQNAGNRAEANRLSDVERQLYMKRDGNQPIVGAEGRAA